MSPTMHDDVETQLRELFEQQASALPVTARAWDDPPLATVTTLAQPRRTRSTLAAIVGTAAAVALVVGVVALAPGRGINVAGQPGAAVPVHFATPQVGFTADALLIDAEGRQFTSSGQVVDVHSDPGDSKYTTLELTWRERGVEMRLYMYFASDGHDWWATELRTYNGHASGDWIMYHSPSTYFRSPLGQPFAGNVDFAATDGTGHLRISNLKLQAFLPPAQCAHPTTKYALAPSYATVSMVNDATTGFGTGTTALLDTATCKAVSDPSAFTYDWKINDPAVAQFRFGAGSLRSEATGVALSESPDLAPKGTGSTVLHATAHERSTGKVVATADIPVTVAAP
ncbi:MAG TPA: hypothetical protein VGP92_18955 [Acidimicrobiia bacterium]|nr:hypothetical protein [Acidimicrobiia bacterium]